MNKHVYQEVLVALSSDFFSREFFLNEHYPGYESAHPKELLAEAFWNGLLHELLPEVTPRMQMTQISEGNEFLNVCLGYENKNYVAALSINPYYFLNHSRKN